MNINNDKFYQCSQCKKDFSEQDVYRVGIKKKDFFCRECVNNIKSECMWCGKELDEKKWRKWGHENPSGELEETIDYDNHRKEKHQVYSLSCKEVKEHGYRPNKSCPSRINDWWVSKKNQKCQDRKNQGWKNCAGKGVYHKDPKTGKVIFDLDCYKLVPPGQRYCRDDSCVYYTAVYNGLDSKERKRIRQKWDQRDQEKYQKANEWWNSLTEIEKKSELRKEEEHLKSLGLQQQRCWLEKLDQNSILFEDGKIYYDSMDKIPPSFMDRFGYPGYHWENVWKNDSNCSNIFQAQTEIKKEISNKEVALQQAKESGDNETAIKLEQQIQELKSQQDSIIVENPNKNNTITYLVIGLALVLLIGVVVLLARSKHKSPKIK